MMTLAVAGLGAWLGAITAISDQVLASSDANAAFEGYHQLQNVIQGVCCGLLAIIAVISTPKTRNKWESILARYSTYLVAHEVTPQVIKNLLQARR
ncbi:MAG: hypothetical protein V1735_02470 [Nanoarchaeota archaeon]